MGQSQLRCQIHVGLVRVDQFYQCFTRNSTNVLLETKQDRAIVNMEG